MRVALNVEPTTAQPTATRISRAKETTPTVPRLLAESQQPADASLRLSTISTSAAASRGEKSSNTDLRRAKTHVADCGAIKPGFQRAISGVWIQRAVRSYIRAQVGNRRRGREQEENYTGGWNLC